MIDTRFHNSAAVQAGPASHTPWRYFVYVRKSSEPDDRQVLSIPAQKQELARLFGQLKIVDLIEESQSAKAPGRPQFERMLRQIEAGRAEGIIAWHPDRLARNSVDGGRIIYGLDQGKLRDLKFAQYTFENSPEGKWMLNIIFGQSKYFVDKLSKDVKRGLNAKLERGWRPNLAPIGYLNNSYEEKGTKSIRPDPDRFALVCRIWELMLTGAYTVPQIRRFANDEWGLRSPTRKKNGNRPLSTSTLYRILTNPFYYGVFSYNGTIYRGQHKAMITEDQFWRVQKLLGRKGRPRAKTRRHFAYTGMIRCGECGSMITAEEKWKRNKTNDGIRHYVYYRCTKRKAGVRCLQPCIRIGALEAQINSFLGTLTISEEFLQWALDYVQRLSKDEVQNQKTIYKSQAAAYKGMQRQLDELLNLRLRQLITDEEFERKRIALVREREYLKGQLADTGHRSDRWIEAATTTVRFSHELRERFQRGSIEDKRIILETVGSNLILRDMKLRLEPVKPFVYLQCATQKSKWSRIINDVRKFCLGTPKYAVLTLPSQSPTTESIVAFHDESVKRDPPR